MQWRGEVTAASLAYFIRQTVPLKKIALRFVQVHTRAAKTSCHVLVRGSPAEPLDARFFPWHGRGPPPA